MTSIAHPVLPGAVPAVSGSGISSTVSERLARPAGSKALRVGLGVAIAAVMAGDVYAVLRSPVSEGRGVGSPAAASATLDGTGSPAGSGFASTAGHVAANPFSEAAWGASTGAMRAASPFGGGAATAAATPAASTALPAAPSGAAPTIVLPTLPSTTGPAASQPPVVPPTTPGTDGDPASPPPPPPAAAAGPVSQVVTPVVQQVEQTVPQAAPVTQAVTDVGTTVDQTVPTDSATTVADTAPVTTVTSGLTLR